MAKVTKLSTPQSADYLPVNRLGATILAFFLFSISGCNLLDNKAADVKGQHFNMSQFINAQCTLLSKQHMRLEKKVFLNGNSESQTLKVENWQKELSAFSQADIDKPAFYGKYEIDSTFRNQNLSFISYRALADKLKIRELDIAFDSLGNPVNINVKTKSRNVLYASSQVLTFETQNGYIVSGIQSIQFLRPDTFKVTANWIQ